MRRFHYVDPLTGNTSDPLTLAALQQLNLPQQTNVLPEGSQTWTTLGDVMHEGPILFPAPPTSASQTADSKPPLPGVVPESRPAESAAGFYPTFFLALFLGLFGVHRFYLAKFRTGLLQLVSLGGCGLWWLFDVVAILIGKFKDKHGRVIRNVHPRVSWSVFAAVVLLGIARHGENPSSGTKSDSSAAVSQDDLPRDAVKKEVEKFMARGSQDSEGLVGQAAVAFGARNGDLVPFTAKFYPDRRREPSAPVVITVVGNITKSGGSWRINMEER